MLRILTNDDFLQLVELNAKMYYEAYNKANAVGATATLMKFVMEEGFTAFGVFDENNRLLGFSHGYKILNKTFYFSGIYVIIKNNKNTKKLIDFSFEKIKELGYDSWELDATNSNITSIIEKYGATKISTKFRKEI